MPQQMICLTKTFISSIKNFIGWILIAEHLEKCL